MCAMEEQARRGLAESGPEPGVGHPGARVASDRLDPTRAEQTEEKAESSERRQQKLAGWPTDLNRDCILAACQDSAQRCLLAVTSKTRWVRVIGLKAADGRVCPRSSASTPTCNTAAEPSSGFASATPPG